MPHIHEKIDFVADVFIVCKNKVLLRKHDKHKIWLAVGGHIELDEDPVTAALREVREEVGLEVTLIGNVEQHESESEDLLPPRYLNRHRINATHEHISFIYFARSTTDELVEPETERSLGCKWFTKEELLRNEFGIRASIIAYALNALEIAAQE